MTQVKICGLRAETDVKTAAEAGATMAGFVFVPDTPRAVSAKTASGLAAYASNLNVKAVGLFAQAAPAEIVAITSEVPLDAIQLHGRETPEQVRAIRNVWAGQIILARGVSQESDFSKLDDFDIDMFLFDAKPASGVSVQGGHGATFDWPVLRAYQGNTPWMLAGGLTAENVESAVRAVAALPNFSGVDVSSGVEREKGIKDPSRIVAFVHRAQAAMGQPII